MMSTHRHRLLPNRLYYITTDNIILLRSIYDISCDFIISIYAFIHSESIYKNLPIEKGMKPGMFLIFPSLSSHLSGSKTSGFFRYFSSLRAVYIFGRMILPPGMVYPANSTSALLACGTENATESGQCVY